MMEPIIRSSPASAESQSTSRMNAAAGKDDDYRVDIPSSQENGAEVYSQDDLNSIGACSITESGAAQHMPSAPYKRLQHATDKNSLLAFCGGLLFLLGSLLVIGPAAVLIISLVPLCWLARRIVQCCCCVYTRSCNACTAARVATMDSYWLHDSLFNRHVIQCLFDLEGGLDVCRIRDLINARLVCSETKHKRKEYPRFTQKVVPQAAGFIWQTDDCFNINDHIFTMPTSIRTRDELAQYISQLAGRGLSTDKPLWEMHVLTNFGETNDTMVLFRIHPCLSDGMSLLKLFYQIVDDTSGVYIKNNFGRVAMMFNIVRAFVIGPFVFLSKLCTRQSKNILHRPKLSGRKVVAWSEPFDFSRAHRIKQVTRGKLNDILISAISGSLRSFMQAKGVTNPYDCRTTLHIDLRPTRQELRMGNQFIFTDIVLPTNTEGAIPRLWEIKHRMDDLKNSSDPTVLYGFHFILSTILPHRWYRRVFDYLLNKTSAVIVNLPGPDVTLRFGSREIKGMVHWMPTRSNVPLSLCVASYGDQIRLSVMADSAVLPDPELITTDFILQMKRLTELLAHRRIPGEHSLRTRLSIPSMEGPQAEREPTVDELQEKMLDVQQQLQDVKQQLDEQLQSADYGREAAEYQVLQGRLEELKEEFRDLLAELRRQKAAEGATLLSDDEEDEEVEVRQVYRKRSLSNSSRRSLASVTARPLHTSGSGSHSTPASHAVTPGCGSHGTPASHAVTTHSSSIVTVAGDDHVHRFVTQSTTSSITVEHILMRDHAAPILHNEDDHDVSPAVERRPCMQSNEV